MGSDLQYVELSSLVSEKPRNGLYKGKEFQGSGHRWIKMGEVFKNDFFLNQETELLEVTESEIERFSCEAGDLLFGRTSLTLEGVGDCLLIKDINDNPIFESNLFRIRFDRSIASPLFYYYYFKSGYGKQLIQKIAKQTAATSITSTDLINQPVPFFPLLVQKKIAELIHMYDRKIELNRQMNETLESMAQALFKSWFVDFDPVIDNALAAGNPIPDVFAERAEQRRELNANAEKTSSSPNNGDIIELSVSENETASSLKSGGVSFNGSENSHPSLFPSEFEFTEEMGWIPEGWGGNTVESLIDLIGGGTPKTSIDEYWNGTIPWFSVVDAPNPSDVFVIDTEKHVTGLGVEKSSTKILPVGTTIISARGTVGKCAIVAKPMAMNQSCYGIRGKGQISDSFVYYLIYLSVVTLQQRGHGSVFNTITKETFKSIHTPFCGEELTIEFNSLVKPLLDKVLANSIQADTLSKLRDTLLPKLLSGELRIPDAEKLIKEAGV